MRDNILNYLEEEYGHDERSLFEEMLLATKIEEFLAFKSRVLAIRSVKAELLTKFRKD